MPGRESAAADDQAAAAADKGAGFVTGPLSMSRENLYLIRQLGLYIAGRNATTKAFARRRTKCGGWEPRPLLLVIMPEFKLLRLNEVHQLFSCGSHSLITVARSPNFTGFAI
jgi:hypothetical protein